MKTHYKTLRLILGDQLNSSHSWYENLEEGTLYVMMEMRQETDYVTHHIQKLLAFFAAMRAFAQELQAKGGHVIYLKLDDPRNQQNLEENLQALIDTYGVERFEYQAPDEYRLSEQLGGFCQQVEIATQVYSSEHFLCSKDAFQKFFQGKKQYLMENFYRHMRRQYNILMEGDQPVGEQWNYDAENRKKLPKCHQVPEPFVEDKDVSALWDLLRKMDVSYIGSVDPGHFIWPTTRGESLKLLDHFFTNCLPFFGTYQDAMSTRSWSVYHARISFSLNTKMLSPLEVIQGAIAHWQKHQEEISLAQIEGFVRQILGWREYMRGIYWAHMPEYRHMNFFGHTRKLPNFFWSAETKMRCLKEAIGQSLHYGYAHHIQRLMVTGNFALLAGIDPDAVDNWYLGIYLDAIEWVEITNTRGMSQFADGGIVGSKPYVASANYMNKMGDYCSGCTYDKKQKTGEGACPFNSLYWHFYARNRDKLKQNPRVGMMYRVWDKMPTDQQAAILKQAEEYLSRLDDL